jgi:hypothetical protein
MSVLYIYICRPEMESQPQATSERPESPVVWPDPKRPGNHFLSIYLLGGFEIDDGNIELRNVSPKEVDASGNVQEEKK